MGYHSISFVIVSHHSQSLTIVDGFLHYPWCPSSLSALYKWVPGYRQRWKCERTVFVVVWLNASRRSRVGVGMNRSARGWSVKRFKCPMDWRPRHIRPYQSVLDLLSAPIAIKLGEWEIWTRDELRRVENEWSGYRAANFLRSTLVTSLFFHWQLNSLAATP